MKKEIPLKLFNTLTRKKEVFKPIDAKGKKIGMYSCGPTVYWYQHIGNFRTMLLNDLLKKTLSYNSYKVKHVMNITDVDDKTIKGSRKEGISLQELTKKYEDIFFRDLNELNIIKPDYIMRATKNINEMVGMIKELMKKGYAYETSDGIYFSIKKFKNYGKLAQLDKIKISKERISADEYDKNNARDFALWKFYSPEDGDVFWETEIGKGRPGWHIECSAMSMKSLGEHFDIHTGGIDLLFPHHTNEIAQSEAATGKRFVNYWLHGAFLLFKGEKVSKSKGGLYTISELEELGYFPLHFRYLCLQTHYRKPLDFSLDNLDAARSAYERIKRKIIEIKKENHKMGDKSEEYRMAFLEAINDDLNMPRALQIFIEALDDFDFDNKKKIILLEEFDEVFGLGIKGIKEEKIKIPLEVIKLIKEREMLRKSKKWAEADVLRERIRERGYVLEDSEGATKVSRL